ncbi:MAG: hypothetical protein NPIRA01_11990 [Nitrospirales bacterium]|nr:MAG: hypothetical protein NPIRA01_11990 [Nitrospirales bacterium]
MRKRNQRPTILLSIMGCLSLLCVMGTVTPVQATSFTAFMNSSQEIAPAGLTNSPLTGLAQLQLRQISGTYALSFMITVDSGFDFQGFGTPNPMGGELVSALHFHNQDRGSNGPVVFGIFGPSSDLDGDTMTQVNTNGTTTVTGEWDQTEGNGGATLTDFLPSLLNAQPGQDVPLYLNLHTANDPSGVIRGQLAAVPEPGTLLLFGSGLLGLLGYHRYQRKGVQ